MKFSNNNHGNKKYENVSYTVLLSLSLLQISNILSY